jgi:hypothetical protein
MNDQLPSQLLVWGILLTIFVVLPALLRRSRVRSWHRNRVGACGRCGTDLDGVPAGYMEGFGICSRCARLQRRSTTIAFGFLLFLCAAGALAAGLGALSDMRRGVFGPWWVYVLVGGSCIGLMALFGWVWRGTRAVNRRAAERDAAATRRYDPDDSFEP